MAMHKTIRRVTDLQAQQEETLRYWQSRTPAERMNAVAEIVQAAYLSKEIDLDRRPTDKHLVRVERLDWKAI
jgi:hypothetical protein